MSRYLRPLLFILGILLCGWALADLPGFRELYDSDKYYNYSSGTSDSGNLRNVLIQVFKNISIVIFIIALIVAFISVIKLLVSSNEEEDFSTWIKTLVWSIAGLLLISVAYTIIRQFELRVTSSATLSTRSVYNVVINIVYPILNFLRYIAATVFFLAAIYAFYKIVTAGGNEEGFQQGKKIFIGGVLGFIIMMLAEPIVRLAYGGGRCGGTTIFGISTDCTRRVFDTASMFGIIAKVIVFINGFLALVVILMIMYAGFLVLTGGGDEEKSQKAKKTIMYAIIGILILLFSYVIYRFMILQS